MFHPCEKPIGFHYTFSAETGNFENESTHANSYGCHWSNIEDLYRNKYWEPLLAGW